MAGSVDEVAKALHRWRTEEMKYTCPDKNLTISPENLKELCCGPLLDVWKYVTANVYSNKTVHTARGNIELQSRDYETKTDTDDGLPSAEELEKSLRMVESELEGVRSDIDQLQTDLNSKYETEYELIEATRRCQRVSHCYRMMTNSVTDDASVAKLSLDRLTTLVNCQNDDAADNCNSSDKSNSCKNMALFEQNLSFIVENLRPTIDSVLSTKDREMAGDLVRQCLVTCSHTELAQWMEKLQNQARISLQQSVRQRDELMNVEEERFAASAQRVIDSLRLTHVQWCSQALSLHSNYSELASQLKDRLIDRLHSLTSTDETGEIGKAVNRYIHQQSKDYSKQLLKTLCQQLEQESHVDSCSSEEEIQEVPQSFDETLNAVNSIFAATTRHRQERTSELSTQLQSSAQLLHSAISAQTDLFPQTIQTVTAHVYQDARVLCLGGGRELGAPQLCTAAVPLVQWRLRELELVMTAGEARCSRLLQRLRRQTDCSVQLEGVVSHVNAALQREANILLPKLQQSSEKLKKVAEAINAARHSLKIWKDEPAQAAANDVVYDGLTFPQWCERYRANCTAQRTLPSNK